MECMPVTKEFEGMRANVSYSQAPDCKRWIA